MKSARSPGETRAESSRLRNQRGAVLVFVALGLIGFLGIAALAIDVGLLYVARSEAQRAADAAAHAGAGHFLLSPDDQNGARQTAVDFAALNTVRGTPVSLSPGNIDIETGGASNRRLVRVRVLRTEESGGAIPTLFARVLGFDRVGVSASAAAEVFTLGGANCILPIAVQDRFCRTSAGLPCPPGDLSSYGENWSSGGQYMPWIQNPQAPPEDWVINEVGATGYSDFDVGQLLVLTIDEPTVDPRPGQGASGGGQAGGLTPWWAWAARADQSAGNPELVDLFQCEEGVNIGDQMRVVPGNRIRADLIRAELNAIMDDDLDAEWDEQQHCVTSRNSSECRFSSRIRPVVLYDPRETPQTPAQEYAAANLMGVFIDFDRNNTVTGRIVPFSEIGRATPGLLPGTFGRMIRIVE